MFNDLSIKTKLYLSFSAILAIILKAIDTEATMALTPSS